MKSVMSLIACSAVLLGSAGALWAEPIPASEVAGWLDWNLAELVGSAIGPEGGQIFPLWPEDCEKARLEGILLRARAELDIGVVVPAILEVYLDPMDLKLRTVAFEPERQVSLEEIEEYFGTRAERRLCRPAEVEIPLDAPLVPAKEKGVGVLEEAVFPQVRMVAEMFREEGSVTRLRWVGREKSLEGCP